MIPNFNQVDMLVWRGGEPDDDGWNMLNTKYGIQKVIKLDSECEGTDVACEALKMQLLYYPISLMQQLIMRPSMELIQNAVDAMSGVPTYVHCLHGEDRTGLVCGAYRVWRQNWKKEDAYNEMIKLGFHPSLLGLLWFWSKNV